LTRAIVTIVSNNYLHYARTLMQSVAQHEPDAARYCLIVDRDREPALALQRAGEFTALWLDQVGLPDGDDFLFQYTVLELNTAVKPWALAHLAAQGHAELAYIDPDIELHAPLAEVWRLLQGGSEVVLTPHLLAPLTDNHRPTELDIRRAGTYNLGFVALRATPGTQALLRWWQGKLRRECIVAQDRGIFVDQSWMDLAPGLFGQVAVLRHPGYNVAYWNLAQRSLATAPGGGITVNGQPLVFFHFSGLDPRDPHPLSKHQNRYSLDNIGAVGARLVRDYVRRVLGNALERYRAMPYGFGTYADGTAIADAERARYRDDPALREECGHQPFDHPGVICSRFRMADAPGVAPGHTYRLQFLYQRLLGRLPERAALAALGPRMGSVGGMLRTVLSVGLSPEARRTPGWLARLISLANEVHLVPRPLKVAVVQPLWHAANWLGRRGVGALVWRPPGRVVPPSIADTHYVIRPDRAHQAPTGWPDSLTCPPGINLVGYIKAELGLGEAARALARACHAVDLPFSLTDVGYQSSNLQRDDSVVALGSGERFNIDLLYVNADQTPATTQQLQASGRPQADYTIGFWHWEQPDLPPHLQAAFAHLDEVWAPSTFVHDAISNVSPIPVFKVPHAVQVPVGVQSNRVGLGLPDGKVLVLVMYDFHSYQTRKNPQAAVAAFRRAARQHPELHLVLKTINGQAHPEAFAELEQSLADLSGQVTLLTRFLTREQVWQLQASCDVLLSLHRAEGFGLGPAEMMALGKPVVATGWSANMDFMTPENSMPVRYTLQPLAQDVGAYPAGPLWAEACVAHAAECLARLAAEPALRQQIGARAAADIAAHLSPQAVGQRIRRRLQQLGHWHPALQAKRPL